MFYFKKQPKNPSKHIIEYQRQNIYFCRLKKKRTN
jgi:hypothetical protein